MVRVSSNDCMWTAFTSQTCTKDYSIVPSSISPNSSAPTVGSISGFPSSTRKNNAWPFGCLQVRSQQRSASVPRGDEQEADDVSYCNDSTHSCPIATLNSTKVLEGVSWSFTLYPL